MQYKIRDLAAEVGYDYEDTSHDRLQQAHHFQDEIADYLGEQYGVSLPRPPLRFFNDRDLTHTGNEEPTLHRAQRFLFTTIAFCNPNPLEIGLNQYISREEDAASISHELGHAALFARNFRVPGIGKDLHEAVAESFEFTAAPFLLEQDWISEEQYWRTRRRTTTPRNILHRFLRTGIQMQEILAHPELFVPYF